MGTAGHLQLEEVHTRVYKLAREAVNTAGDSYVDFGPLYTQAYDEVGRMPIATFVRDELIGLYQPYVTGTYSEYEWLSRGLERHESSFGVPFSNGEIDNPNYSRNELANSSVTPRELAQIFSSVSRNELRNILSLANA